MPSSHSSTRLLPNATVVVLAGAGGLIIGAFLGIAGWYFLAAEPKPVEKTATSFQFEKRLNDQQAELSAIKKRLSDREAEIVALRTPIEKKPTPQADTVKDDAPKTFGAALEKVKLHVAKLENDEPMISEAVTRSLARDEAGAKLTYQFLKRDWNKNATPLDNPDWIDQLERAGYTYAINLFAMKRALEEKDTLEVFEKLWRAEWSADDLAERLIYFRLLAGTVRIPVKKAIVNGLKPATANAKNAIIAIAGKDYLERLR